MMFSYRIFLYLSSHTGITSHPLHHLLHSSMVIPLNFEIGNPAVALRGLDSRVPEEILNGYQVGICIQQLGCHRMPELVTGDL